ncbi:Ribosomal RNA small subunit methyltransferase G [Variovorax sp. SRS16]|uniref:16S rRNA (guanine(527)-N(7))-methyltransferase RsmG n=1 Tax=Variovorax sp. SRS16 TaxID=282217 RepID=UPI0013170C1B|nr:16S rRNA (guanine(527)-N(7))-methyltransferase RsmG [Variovorax sp. SRS16]VTU12797.1 Ribosomal RNA small subunit methyltransferase G [Variovorax sp. SRS16]
MSQDRLLREGASALGIELTDRQCEQLLAYSVLILKWNKVYNLTALRDPATVLTHHLLDSLAVAGPLRRERPSGATLLDVGAGAGLPGVVIAILRDDIHVTCLDAVAKKAAFVQQVTAELELANLRGLHARVEALSGSYDIVSSRAFASLPDFFRQSRQLLAEEGVWLAMKGRVPSDELAQLPSDIDVFHVEQLNVPGLDAERCIVWARKRLS